MLCIFAALYARNTSMDLITSMYQHVQVSIVYKILQVGRFHPFYTPRRPLGRVEV
jgi:hypothetical protein